jgi:protein farnesyltransferase subunit beta
MPTGASAAVREATETEDAQRDVELSLRQFFARDIAALQRPAHAAFLGASLGAQSDRMQGLDCSRCWLVYWVLHAADVLGVTDELYAAVPRADIAGFLLFCLEADGECSGAAEERDNVAAQLPPGAPRRGFAGGPGQCPHLAATYAAVCALAVLSLDGALAAVDKAAVANWLISLRNPDGSFRMHRSGEVDIRASYCAAVAVQLLGLDAAAVLPPRCAEYVGRCQTYEGGIGSCADGGSEAHGGYTQCGLAALHLMVRPDAVDLPNLRRWCAARQQRGEGGFCGRANKLVDSCYSFWLGSAAVMCSVAEAMLRVQRGDALAARDVFLLDYAAVIDLAEVELDAAVMAPESDALAGGGGGGGVCNQEELQ